MMPTPLHAAQRSGRCARQQGVSLISAIFMLLLFAALAAYMVSLTNTANVTSAQDINGVRAYQAAQAGLEWGAYQVLVPATASCAASTTLPAAINDFTVTVTCRPYGPYTEAGATFTIYRLVSKATSSVAVGGPGFAEREVSGAVSR